MKFEHKKSLGQHFLNNNSIIQDIINSAEDLAQKNVIEIGPGNLALTEELVKNAAFVTSIEKDDRLSTTLEIFKQKHSNFNYTIADAMYYTPPLLENSVLIANLPYNVGTQIYLNYLLNTKLDYFILMFQKEVAQRIVARIGDAHYGRLSIITELYANSEMLFIVEPNNFTPAPKVHSAVIKITPLAEIRFKVNVNVLEMVTKTAFNQRRKVISNSLKTLNVDFETLEIDSRKRPEELSLQEYCKIANSIN